MSREKVERLIAIRPYLEGIPIVANADFGHTSPIFTFPFGGEANIIVGKNNIKFTITKH